jgi:uncharacterized protein (TIGR02391 family)
MLARSEEYIAIYLILFRRTKPSVNLQEGKMNDAINYRLIAIKIGNLLKYDVTVNEISRVAEAIFRFRYESFPNASITSQRAQLVFDWILSLAKQQMNPEERVRLLIKFCKDISTSDALPTINGILLDAGVPETEVNRDDLQLFLSRSYHHEIIKHCKKLFIQGNYFHAVFEASKIYNLAVKEKSKSSKDGNPLMLEVWGCEKGVLKITACVSQTDKDVQDGVKFLSAGLMSAIRNPTAHEPALLWPIIKQDCLDILSFISFLFRQLDKATYFKT